MPTRNDRSLPTGVFYQAEVVVDMERNSVDVTLQCESSTMPYLDCPSWDANLA